MSDLPRGLVPVLSGANFVIGMGAFLVIGVLAPLGRDLNLTADQAGWVMTAYALAYTVLSPLLVSLTGGLGRRRVLALGMGLFAAASALSALAPSVEVLFAARILAAAGAGMTTPVAAAVAAGLAAPERRGQVLAMVFFGLTVAQVMGVPAGSWIAYTFGWRMAFGLVAVLAVGFAVVIWLRVPGGLRFQAVRLSDLASVIANWRLMVAITFTAVFLGAIWTPFTYLAPMLEELMGLGRNGVTAILVVCGLGAVVGNLAGGWVTDRIGSFRTLLGAAVLQVGLMPLLSFLPVPLAWAIVLFFAWNAIGYGFNSAQQGRLVALAGAQAPVALAVNAACIYLGAAIGATLGGVVIAAGPGVAGLGIAGGLSGLIAVAWILWSHRLSPVDTAAPRP